MKKKQRQQLRAQLAGLPDNERRKLLKRASRLRKTPGTAQRGPKNIDPSHWEEEESEQPREVRMTRRGRRSIHEAAAELLAEVAHESGPHVPPDRAPAASATRTALVIGTVLGRATVELAPAEVEVCTIPSAQAGAAPLGHPVVGDIVLVSQATATTPAHVLEVLPRRTTLSRPCPASRGQVIEQVLAANLDRVVVVASVRDPPLRPRLLDRYLIAIERGGARPVLALNKIDLLTDDGRAQLADTLAPYVALGVPHVLCAAATGEGLAALAALVRGATCALVGPSGVGKSSLVNALVPDAAQRLGAVNDATGKGRHTTTASQLFALPDGTRLIDTPGTREFGLWKLTAEELRWAFPEFAPHAASCRFADCSHRHEPTCAVRSAVEASTIHARRYDTYLRLWEEVGG